MDDKTALQLTRQLSDELRATLPAVAEHVVGAVTAEVPAYTDAFSGPTGARMGATIQNAVEVALGGFLELASRAQVRAPGSPRPVAVEGAYALGRGEARSGRTADALLAAYRVGGRVAWRELSTTAVTAGLEAATLAQFAELVFAYIDQLSAASVAGHEDELATTGRVRQRYLDLLAQALLRGDDEEALRRAAERAEWAVPATLTAVLVPTSQVRPVLALLEPSTLTTTEDPGLAEGYAVVLVPDADGRRRRLLLRRLAGRPAVIGPSRLWSNCTSSYARAVRTLALVPRLSTLMDSDEHLAELVLTADPLALQDLRAQALAPLAGLRPTAADKLAQTLRSWLLHHGRREDVAAELFVHPQTVRYRVGQLRELYGDRLTDPASVLQLTVALGVPER